VAAGALAFPQGRGVGVPGHRTSRIRDYELASDLSLEQWLRRVHDHDGLVPVGDPVSEVDDIGRSVLRFEMVQVEHQGPSIPHQDSHHSPA
jgi:hypothetical protein